MGKVNGVVVRKQANMCRFDLFVAHGAELRKNARRHSALFCEFCFGPDSSVVGEEEFVFY